MNKALSLARYVNNCDETSLLAQQIQELDHDILITEHAIEMALTKSVEEALLKELHNLRVEHLGLELRLNKIEHDILEFELEEELRD